MTWDDVDWSSIFFFMDTASQPGMGQLFSRPRNIAKRFWCLRCSSHVAAGVFNFLGGTVETLNHLVFPAGVKQQRLFFCVQSLRDNPLVFTTPMGGISVAKSTNKLTHEWYLGCIGLQCPRTQPRGHKHVRHHIESIPL